MAAITTIETADVAALRENAGMVEKLLASGAISAAEREQLLDQFWTELQADRDACARRARFAPTTTLSIGEKIMNAKDTVTQIEQAHAVMGAQVRKLNEISPTPLAMPQGPAGGANGLADLLHATVAGHVANAADSLRAIAEVEASLRAPVGRPVETTPANARREPEVIDAEFRQVK